MRIFQGQPTSWIQLRPQHIAHWNHKAWPRAHNNLRPFRFQSHRKQKSQQASSARALKFLHVKVGCLAWLFWKSPRRNNGQTWKPSWVQHPTFARLRLQWWAALHCGQSLKLRPDSRFVTNWHFLTNPCHILISWCPASTKPAGYCHLVTGFSRRCANTREWEMVFLWSALALSHLAFFVGETNLCCYHWLVASSPIYVYIYIFIFCLLYFFGSVWILRSE